MITHLHGARTAQRGIVLVSSLLLLLVVTIIALSMFRSFGIQEKIAGNTREKQRALQAAMTAQQYAEWWLSNNGATSAPVACTAPRLNANLNQGQICSNKLPTVVADVTQVPWGGTAAKIGVTYTPTNMLVNATPTNNVVNPTYYDNPTFYISDMGASFDPNIPGEIYQVDAAGYGGNANTVAVVESTYAVYTSSACRGCP
jgi:type IV pilus assembly protein PilX